MSHTVLYTFIVNFRAGYKFSVPSYGGSLFIFSLKVHKYFSWPPYFLCFTIRLHEQCCVENLLPRENNDCVSNVAIFIVAPCICRITLIITRTNALT